MGKFFNDEPKKEKSPIIKYIIIGIAALIVIALIVIIIIKSSGKKFELKANGVTMGINEIYPDPKDFFKKIDKEAKVEADYSKCDNTKIGDCTVILTGDIKKTKATLHIKDFTPPELVIKEEYQINPGATYEAKDFVESCTDNLDEECTISFYDKATDDNGAQIDYSSYTDEGTYSIKVIATDSSNNESDVYESKLIIGSIACEYGDLKYDETKYPYPIAAPVSEECAINKTLYNDKNTQEIANIVYNQDYENLKTDMQAILSQEYPQGANITVCPKYIPVFNNTGRGLIGYSIYVSVFINETKKIECTDPANEEYKVLSYYLYNDGTREYENNKYDV